MTRKDVLVSGVFRLATEEEFDSALELLRLYGVVLRDGENGKIELDYDGSLAGAWANRQSLWVNLGYRNQYPWGFLIWARIAYPSWPVGRLVITERWRDAGWMIRDGECLVLDLRTWAAVVMGRKLVSPTEDKEQYEAQRWLIEDDFHAIYDPIVVGDGDVAVEIQEGCEAHGSSPECLVVAWWI